MAEAPTDFLGSARHNLTPRECEHATTILDGTTPQGAIFGSVATWQAHDLWWAPPLEVEGGRGVPRLEVAACGSSGKRATA